MKSKIYSSDYMKTATKGQLWIPALLTLGYLMAFPVMTILMLGNWFGTKYLTIDQIGRLYELLWTDGLMSSGFIITSAAALINGINHFWYLYSSRKTDFYHCLPIRRQKIFLHKTVMGIFYYLVPYIIMEFFVICIGAARGFFSLKIMKMALMMTVMHFILYLLFYFATVLVICLTGNILMGALCLTAIFLYGIVLGDLILYYRSVFYRNSYFDEAFGIQKILQEYASPYSLGKNFLYAYSAGEYFSLLAAVLMVTVVLGVLAYAAFVKRPSESAGKPVIYDWVSVIIKFMVVVPCGLGCGLIFYTLPDSGSKVVWWIFGLVFGTVLSHGCLEILYQMDFRKFFAKKHHLVLAGILVIICAVNYKLDLMHFDEYLPDRKEIAAFNADLSGILHYTCVSQTEDGFYKNIGSWTGEETVLTKEDGIGENTWKTLERIISKQKLRNSGVVYMYTYRDTENGWKYALPVKYTLKNGSEVYRKYYLGQEDVYNLLKCLYEEGTLKEKYTSFTSIEDQYLKNVSGTFMDNMYYRLFQEEPQKKLELLNALRADFEEANAEELLGEPCACLEFDYEVPHEPEEYEINISSDGLSYTHLYSEVMVYPTFKRTLAILKETSYPLTVDDLELDYVTVTYWNDDAGNDSYDEIEYTDKEELEALKKAIVPYYLGVHWLKYESDMDVLFYLKGSMDSGSGWLKSEKIPDFVKKRKVEEEKGQLPSAETAGIEEMDVETAG